MIKKCEETALAAGCVNLRCEILSPRDWKHPVKSFQDGWYQKLGYVKGKAEPFLYPHILPFLDGPMLFTPYVKPLKK